LRVRPSAARPGGRSPPMTVVVTVMEEEVMVMMSVPEPMHLIDDCSGAGGVGDDEAVHGGGQPGRQARYGDTDGRHRGDEDCTHF
jgi:hypothetical protein